MLTNSEINTENPKNACVYEFGDFRLDLQRNILSRHGVPLPLTYKALQTLVILVENSGELVEKEEIMQRVWQNTFVEEGSLTRNISTLRKTLGEQPSANEFIETVPRRGYRFVATVNVVIDECEDSISNVDYLNNFQDAVVESPPQSNSENLLSKTTISNTQTATFEEANNQSVKINLQTSPSKDASQNVSKRSLSKILIIALPILFLIGTYAAIRVFTGDDSGKNITNTAANVQISKLTNIGNVYDAIISPDGRYIVYVVDSGGQQSLWVKQVLASGSPQEIIPTANVSYQGLAFSPDGDFIFYNVWDRKSVGAIYRIPTLGGISTKIINDCMPSVSISPDGSRVAFIRAYSTEKEQALITANANGSDEQTITRSNFINWFSSPTWSPSGESIAVVVGSNDDSSVSRSRIVEYLVSEKSERYIGEKQWVGISGLAWSQDGANLVLNGTDEAKAVSQIWKVNHADGNAQKITNDVTGYTGAVSVASKTGDLVVVQRDSIQNIWVGESNNLERVVKVTSGKNEGLNISWTPDGKIVYDSLASGNPDIWIMNPDGSNKRQLTDDKAGDFAPVVSADGTRILFTSDRSGNFTTWEMRINGENQSPLNTPTGWQYTASPASNWYVFIAGAGNGKTSLWKMNLDGSEPTILTNKYSYLPAVSPDGKLIALTMWNDEMTPQKFEYVIISADEGKTIRSFEPPVSALRSEGAVFLRWMPDGKNLSVIEHKTDASNIWTLPLDTAKPRQLTDFKDSRIFTFEWSRSGDKVAVSRGTEISDIVILNNYD